MACRSVCVEEKGPAVVVNSTGPGGQSRRRLLGRGEGEGALRRRPLRIFALEQGGYFVTGVLPGRSIQGVWDLRRGGAARGFAAGFAAPRGGGQHMAGRASRSGPDKLGAVPRLIGGGRCHGDGSRPSGAKIALLIDGGLTGGRQPQHVAIWRKTDIRGRPERSAPDIPEPSIACPATPSRMPKRWVFEAPWARGRLLFGHGSMLNAIRGFFVPAGQPLGFRALIANFRGSRVHAGRGHA